MIDLWSFDPFWVILCFDMFLMYQTCPFHTSSEWNYFQIPYFLVAAKSESWCLIHMHVNSYERIQGDIGQVTSRSHGDTWHVYKPYAYCRGSDDAKKTTPWPKNTVTDWLAIFHYFSASNERALSLTEYWWSGCGVIIDNDLITWNECFRHITNDHPYYHYS